MNDQGRWNWGLWLQWLGVCTLGDILGVPCIALAVSLQDVTCCMNIFALGAFLGTPLAAVQWLVIRRFSYDPGWSGWLRWTLANAIGWAAGFPIMLIFIDAVNSPFGLLDSPVSAVNPGLVALGWLLAGLVFGVPIGVSQWHVLRAEATFAYWPHAGTVWTVGAMVGWGMSIVVLLCVSPAVKGFLDLPAVGVWASMIAGALGGAISGAALVWILRPPAAQEPPAKLD